MTDIETFTDFKKNLTHITCYRFDPTSGDTFNIKHPISEEEADLITYALVESLAEKTVFDSITRFNESLKQIFAVKKPVSERFESRGNAASQQFRHALAMSKGVNMLLAAQQISRQSVYPPRLEAAS